MLKWKSPPPLRMRPFPQMTEAAACAAGGEELRVSFLDDETLVWQQGPTIGTGRFGQVTLALRIPSAELLAVKQIFIQEEMEHGNDSSSLCMQRMLPLAKIEREADIVKSIQHPNIVRFVGCESFGSVYRIFMEYVPAGSLSKILKEHGAFGEAAARHFIRQLVEGVSYLHHLGVAHRDLKCANLLLADDGTVKISDFGSAKRGAVAEMADDEHDEFAQEHETARSVRDGLGSPYWMAPELVRAERGDDNWCKADVWAVGCVLIELVTAKPPWENHSNPMTAMFYIASTDAVPSLPACLSKTAQSFLRSCFDKNPTTRPSAMELLTHPFLRGEKGSGRSTDDRLVAQPSTSENPQQPSTEHGSHEPHHSSRSSSSAFSEKSDHDCDETADIFETANVEIGYSSDESSGEDVNVCPVLSTEFKTQMQDSTGLSCPKNAIGRVRALAQYQAGDRNELSLREGEELIVSGVNEFGWWRGTREGDNSGEEGWFPCTYVEWIPTTKSHTVKIAHDVGAAKDAHGDCALLPLDLGDEVNIAHCDWRDDKVWAYGSTNSGINGWFPIMCVLDESINTNAQLYY